MWNRRTRVILLVAAATLVVPAVSAAAPARPQLQVGSLSLPACTDDTTAWCGTVQVPLDYTDAGAGTITLGFRWYPATTPAPSSANTIMAMEGGPGYPSSGTADDYKALFQPLLPDHNLLLVDLRGTGTSSVIKCKDLQDWTIADSIQDYIDDTGECGAQLDTAAAYGSDLYDTANSARDVARLLGLLQVAKVDFYGDSYGTYFGQTFVARYPGLVRSVTLDAAYPVSNTNPWYPHEIQTAHSAFDLACQRSAACAAAAPGSSWSRIGAFAAQLRTAPITGATEDPNGNPVTETVDAKVLAELVADAGSDSGVYKELDPAIRAAEVGDDVALLRLAAQEIDPGDSGPYKAFSAGLYEAVTCSDYPQPFSMADSLAARRSEYAAAAAALPANEFAPFTVNEWTTNDDEEFDSCLEWPAPRNDDPPIVTPPPYAPPSVPVLVLSGDLDSLTTPPEGQQAAADMGPQSRWILFQNDTHVNALEDAFGCAQGIVRQFVADPQAVNQIDASCASQTPEVRVYGNYPTTVSAVTAPAAAAGNAAGVRGLRLSAIGTDAVGDAIWHWFYASGKKVYGLRGGYTSFAGSGPYTLTLHGVAWTTDTTVSGTATWDQSAGQVTAHLTITAANGDTATVTVSYADEVRHSVATITGSFNGTALAATMPAP